MITITQTLSISSGEEKLILSKGIEYLKTFRAFPGCQNFQLIRNIEDDHLFYFQSDWSKLEDVNTFFEYGLNYSFSPYWNIQDHTIDLSCKVVKSCIHNQLSDSTKAKESLLKKLRSIQTSNLSIRKRPVIKYASSHLTQNQIDGFLDKIRNHMQEFEPFRKKDLTLVKFAKSVELHSHHVSRVINERLHQNFSDFVNSYRVELARKLLVQDLLQRYTISGIGDEAGFNSRTAFYNAFKKFTGMSPGEFIDNKRVSVNVA